MKHLRAKPLALAIMALAASASLNAQENTSETEVDEVEVASPDSGAMEEVYVVGVRAAEQKAREMERQKKIFSSIISQDDAGNFADQNVAESLQRVPGITLEKNEGEGRFVTIRGMGPGFVSVSQNGSEIATSGEDTRAFALDALPSDLLGSIEVFKTLTPDLDLNSIAGTVNVNTVSAFDKNRNTLKLKAQVSNQEFDEDVSPKISLNGTNLIADNTVGIGYALSWERRNSVIFQNNHHADGPPRYVSYNDQIALIPLRYENLQEDAERTRAAGSLSFEYRPTDDHRYSFHYSRTEFEDIDIALREYHRWDQAELNVDNPDTTTDESATDEFWYYNAEQNLYGFADTDLQHQFFIQEGKSITDAVSIGAEHFLDSGWNIDYQLALSQSEWNKPDGRRAQFRLRHMAALGTHGSNYFGSKFIDGDLLRLLTEETGVIQGADVSGYNDYVADSRYQPEMLFDNLFLEDSYRLDDLAQINLNLEKTFDEGRLTSLKFGASAKDRSREYDKNRWSVDPATGVRSIGCPNSVDEELCRQYTGADGGSAAVYGDFASFTPAHPDMQHDFITYEELENLLTITAPVGYASDAEQVNIDSTQSDYDLTEESYSFYAMGEFEPMDNASIIAGFKYEKTMFSSNGNFSVNNDREDNPGEGTQGDILVVLPQAENEYSDILPSIHFKWEPRDDLQYRAALWTSFSRPGYGEARTAASISERLIFCDATENVCAEKQSLPGLSSGTPYEFLFNGNYYVSPALEMQVSNPTLRAMTATNFDTSLAWFPSEDLYFQVALFYKDIKDFIATVRGANYALEDLPIDLPIDILAQQMPIQPGLVYENVVLPINGEQAEVWGTEISFNKNFENGFFVFGNVTLQDSKSVLDPSVRLSSIALPGQADEVANLTVGWENDDISIRLTSNYRGEVLRQIGACSAEDIARDVELGYPRNCETWNDIIEDNTFSLDFKTSWEITDQINVFFDATNLTGDYQLQYFTGNAYSNGKFLYGTEDFGSNYQLGVNYKFL